MTSDEIQSRQLRHALRRELLEILVADAPDMAQVGKRAVLLAFVFRCNALADTNQRQVADFLEISEAAVSCRLKELRENPL